MLDGYECWEERIRRRGKESGVCVGKGGDSFRGARGNFTEKKTLQRDDLEEVMEWAVHIQGEGQV